MLQPKRPLPSAVIIATVFVAFWVCLVVLFAAQVRMATDQTWTQAIRGSLILWVPWMTVSPLMLVSAYLLPIGGTPMWKFIPGHLAISIALLFIAAWLTRNVMPQPDRLPPDQQAQGAQQQGPPAGQFAGQPPGGSQGGYPPPQGGYGAPIQGAAALQPGDPGYGPPPPRPGEPGFTGPPIGADGLPHPIGPDGRPVPLGPDGYPVAGPNGRRGGAGQLGPRGGQPGAPLGPGGASAIDAQGPGTAPGNTNLALLNFFRSLPVGMPLYLTSLFLVGSLNLRRISLEKERRAAELETQLADARLETLRSQLHPHFLFNTLNALMSLVHSNPDKAEEMILCLSSLLRATLEARDKPRIALRDELQLAHDYLAIQSIRYGDRLKTLENFPADTLACTMPPLILQLVLENAIKYAIDRNAAGGTITLRAERLGEKLIIEVEDSGSGRNAEARESHGVGVANVRARLAASFPGKEVGFDLLPNQFGGITARFQLPVTAELEAGPPS